MFKSEYRNAEIKEFRDAGILELGQKALAIPKLLLFFNSSIPPIP
jgi:hypothetical protein